MFMPTQYVVWKKSLETHIVPKICVHVSYTRNLRAPGAIYCKKNLQQVSHCVPILPALSFGSPAVWFPLVWISVSEKVSI